MNPINKSSANFRKACIEDLITNRKIWKGHQSPSTSMEIGTVSTVLFRKFVYIFLFVPLDSIVKMVAYG
jgi:hypothetical protein